MSMAAVVQYMVRSMKMKHWLVNILYHSKPLWFNNPYTTFFFFRNGGGMHIECQYAGANLFVLIISLA